MVVPFLIFLIRWKRIICTICTIRSFLVDVPYPVFGELKQRCDLEQQWTCSGAALHTGSFFGPSIARGGMQCACVDHICALRRILSGIHGIQCLRPVGHLSCLLMHLRKPLPELLPRCNWNVLIHAYTAHPNQCLNWVPHWHGWNYPCMKIKYGIFSMVYCEKTNSPSLMATRLHNLHAPGNGPAIQFSRYWRWNTSLLNLISRFSFAA